MISYEEAIKYISDGAISGFEMGDYLCRPNSDLLQMAAFLFEKTEEEVFEDVNALIRKYLAS